MDVEDLVKSYFRLGFSNKEILCLLAHQHGVIISKRTLQLLLRSEFKFNYAFIKYKHVKFFFLSLVSHFLTECTVQLHGMGPREQLILFCHGSWICVLILCPSVWVDPLVVLVSVA